jgi:hypothetical protein
MAPLTGQSNKKPSERRKRYRGRRTMVPAIAIGFLLGMWLLVILGSIYFNKNVV